MRAQKKIIVVIVMCFMFYNIAVNNYQLQKEYLEYIQEHKLPDTKKTQRDFLQSQNIIVLD